MSGWWCVFGQTSAAIGDNDRSAFMAGRLFGLHAEMSGHVIMRRTWATQRVSSEAVGLIQMFKCVASEWVSCVFFQVLARMGGVESRGWRNCAGSCQGQRLLVLLRRGEVILQEVFTFTQSVRVGAAQARQSNGTRGGAYHLSCPSTQCWLGKITAKWLAVALGQTIRTLQRYVCGSLSQL